IAAGDTGAASTRPGGRYAAGHTPSSSFPGRGIAAGDTGTTSPSRPDEVRSRRVTFAPSVEDTEERSGRSGVAAMPGEAPGGRVYFAEAAAAAETRQRRPRRRRQRTRPRRHRQAILCRMGLGGSRMGICRSGAVQRIFRWRTGTIWCMNKTAV
ncbi:unnamed protein product, partial [Ectocarpus fasciculatus]